LKKLIQHIRSAHKESGEKWLTDLPQLVESLAAKWHLRDLVEFDNLSWNYVAKGSHVDREVVLKLSYDLPTLKREVNALRVFPSGSAVEVIHFDEDRKAVLLEAAHPGKDLLSYMNPDPMRVIDICCDMAQKIQYQQKPSSYPFNEIKNLLQNLDNEWDLPGKMLRTARLFKRELLNIPTETYLIHGDLHRGNILSHGDEWRVIDPKGYRGSIYTEVWPFVHEPITEIPRIAKRLDLNQDRLLKWCFMHAMLATTWCLEDGVDSKNIFGLANKIFPLLG
jgi:streptomycin 6-kinase